MSSTKLLLLCSALCALALGCKKDPAEDKNYTVSGTYYYSAQYNPQNLRPVKAGIPIVLWEVTGFKQGREVASGVTDGQGRYEITYRPRNYSGGILEIHDDANFSPKILFKDVPAKQDYDRDVNNLKVCEVRLTLIDSLGMLAPSDSLFLGYHLFNISEGPVAQYMGYDSNLYYFAAAKRLVGSHTYVWKGWAHWNVFDIEPYPNFLRVFTSRKDITSRQPTNYMDTSYIPRGYPYLSEVRLVF